MSSSSLSSWADVARGQDLLQCCVGKDMDLKIYIYQYKTILLQINTSEKINIYATFGFDWTSVSLGNTTSGPNAFVLYLFLELDLGRHSTKHPWKIKYRQGSFKCLDLHKHFLQWCSAVLFQTKVSYIWGFLLRWYQLLCYQPLMTVFNSACF